MHADTASVLIRKRGYNEISGFEKVLETAKELAKGADGLYLRFYNRDFSVDYKDDRSPIPKSTEKLMII